MFLILGLISHSLPSILMSGKLNSMQSHLVLTNIILGCVFYSIVVMSCVEVDIIIDMMCAVATIHLLSIIYWLYYGAQPVGLMANRNEAAAFMVICSPAFFRKKWICFIFIPIIGLILTRSFGGILGFCLAVIFYLGMKGHKFWPICMMIGISILYWKYIDQPGIELRINAWEKAVKLSFLNLWSIGFGLGRWREIYPNLVIAKAFPEGFQRLHNTFLQNYIEMGVASIIVTLGYYIDIARRMNIFNKAIIPISAIAAITGCCIANSVFRMNAINSMFIITWMAILEIELRECCNG